MAKNQPTQRKFLFKNPSMIYGSSKSAKIVLSKSIFYVKNFSKKKNWYQFRRPFFVKKTFFSNFNFWTPLFSKIIPNFWWTVIHWWILLNCFPLSMLILGQKSCFLRPTIFEIPQLNWYYSRNTVYKTGALPANPCQKCPGIFLANPNFFLFSLGCSYFQLYPRIGNVNDWQQN